MRITRDRFINILGLAPKPDVVWEKQFDYHDAQLAEMARMDWDRVPDNYLWYYFHDLAYSELQPDLFRHLFPACLKYWCETLKRGESAARGDADFHYGLLNGQAPEKMMSESERQSLYDFFRDAFLDRIEAERGFAGEKGKRVSEWAKAANSWIFRFNTLGIAAPVIRPIWEEWWTLDHPGKAACAIEYGSGLVYVSNENPVFGGWIDGHGGGGPYLTEMDSSIFDRVWRDDNLAFLLGTLSVDYVLNKLDQAAAALEGCPEAALAARVAADAKARTELIEIRIGDLVENLSRVQLAKDRWE